MLPSAARISLICVLKNFRRTYKKRTQAKTYVPFGAPRATAFEPRRKRIEICIRKWYCGRGCKTTIRAEKLCEQLQPSRSGRQIRQNVKEKDNE